VEEVDGEGREGKGEGGKKKNSTFCLFIK